MSTPFWLPALAIGCFWLLLWLAERQLTRRHRQQELVKRLLHFGVGPSNIAARLRLRPRRVNRWLQRF